MLLTKIDGRKAVVTDTGNLFTTYTDFSRKHGYPDAAGAMGRYDRRGGIRSGDEVTLLTGGQHLSGYRGKKLWIVETAIGDRYIIGEDGLEIVEVDNSAIIDGLTDTVAKLTLKMAELERKVNDPTGPLHKLTAAFSALGLYSDGVYRSTPEQRQAASERLAERRKPLTRDEIVELAKKDVAELVAQKHGGVRSIISGSMCTYNPGFADSVDFVINREKRTVVALIANALNERPVWARGKARCAPDDCFNVHIGKAVALRRALGLDIPEYYGKAPQPKEPRVGDVVRWNGNMRDDFTITRIDGNRYGFFSHEQNRQLDGLIRYEDAITMYSTIIDDSRDGGER